MQKVPNAHFHLPYIYWKRIIIMTPLLLWRYTHQTCEFLARYSKCLLISPAASHDAFNSGSIPEVGRTRRVSGYHTEVTSGGGLSVTGCLNNFSMFIFHPYGGITKKTSFTSLENTFRKGTIIKHNICIEPYSQSALWHCTLFQELFKNIYIFIHLNKIGFNLT